MVGRGCRVLDGLGALPGYRIQSNSEYYTPYRRSQTVGDKLHGQKGNSPDRQLRSQSVHSVVKDVKLRRQPGCWLRSSHHLKSA